MNDVVHHLAALEAHMDEELPNECVGLLLPDGVLRLRNQAQSPHRFFVNPIQFEDHYDRLRRGVVAMYHSHPMREALPSGEDKRMMEYLATVWPGVFHIILSPHGHRAYHVVDGEICEKDLTWQSSTKEPSKM